MIYTLNGLRALAMLGIFLFHSGLLLNGTFPVTFFFMLSGFVTYYSMYDKASDISLGNQISWIINKLKKLYPIHFITYIASIIIRWNWVSKLSMVEFIKKSVLNLCLIQSLFKDEIFNFNGLSWFLSVIFILYVFSIPLIKIINTVKDKYIIFIMIIIMVIQYSLNIYNIIGNNELYLYSNPLYRILDFSLGMLTASLFINTNIKFNKPYFIENLIVIIFFIMYVISLFIETRCSYYNLLFVTSLYIFAKGKGNISKLLKKNLLQWLAKISFEFYMTHELILIVFRKIFVNINVHWLIKNIIICIPSFFIALILSYLFNKYLSKSLKKVYT